MISLGREDKLLFTQKYLFQVSEEYEKAELLWLWYDYHTEIYDQGLWSQYPAPNDETMVILRSPEARKLSNQNALRVKNYMLEVARKHNLSDDIINQTKNSSYRCTVKIQKRIDEYIELDKQGKFQFINKIK